MKTCNINECEVSIIYVHFVRYIQTPYQ